MHITRSLLLEAVSKGLLDATQAEALWRFLAERGHDTPSFRFTHILYYLGGMIAIGAMTLFMTLGWERFGGWGLCAIAASYAAIALGATHHFLYTRRLPIPAGITATLAVALTPLAVYGLQVAMGWWADGRMYRDYHLYIDWRWMFMELATLASAAVLLWRTRLPFLVMPIAVTLWYMSMDLTPVVFGVEDHSWELRKLVSLWSGVGIMLLGFWVDVRSRAGRDYAFWLYFFGVVAFWSGLSLMRSDSELSKFFYLCINVGLILIGATLGRRIFVVFGALGAAGYVGHLAYGVFKDSMVFPFVLTGIGLAIIALGVVWQRHEDAVANQLRTFLPTPLRELLERETV